MLSTNIVGLFVFAVNFFKLKRLKVILVAFFRIFS